MHQPGILHSLDICKDEPPKSIFFKASFWSQFRVFPVYLHIGHALQWVCRHLFLNWMQREKKKKKKEACWMLLFFSCLIALSDAANSCFIKDSRLAAMHPFRVALTTLCTRLTSLQLYTCFHLTTVLEDVLRATSQQVWETAHFPWRGSTSVSNGTNKTAEPQKQRVNSS